jgi:LPPG:FO 2-phospho-L-lactate transferase
MRIVVPAGGIGAARFLLGLRRAVPDAEITVVGNTGDDLTIAGLRVCPDLDTVMYTLGGGIHPEQGWGRADEGFKSREELAAYGAAPDWFGLGDRDLATHVVRTQLLRDGASLSEATARLCERWRPGVTLLPMTDDPVATRVALADGREIHFQEWWVRLRAEVPASGFRLDGADAARPSPGVVQAIDAADAVLLAPSNPVVSIGTILAVPGLRDALSAAAAPVVGLSPIVGGAPVRGMADACLAAIGVETSAEAVARHYGVRRSGGPIPEGLLDGWLVDETDKAAADVLSEDGLPTRAVPLLMRDVETTADMARAALTLAEEVRR